MALEDDAATRRIRPVLEVESYLAGLEKQRITL
jgi:hypothetical protein